MSDADVPRDPWGNPVPEGVRPPHRPPDSQTPPAPVAPPPEPAPNTSPNPDPNPAWPGRTRTPPVPPPSSYPSPPPPVPSVPPAWPGGQQQWAPPPQPWATPPPANLPDRPRTTGTAIAAMVCGIASILCTGFLGIVLGPTAIGLGFGARRTIAGANGWRTGDGMATAGIVCGIVGTILSIVYLVFLIRNPDFITDFLNDLTTTTTSGKLQGA